MCTNMHDLCIVTHVRMYVHAHIVGDYEVHTHCVSEALFHLVLVFDFEYS